PWTIVQAEDVLCEQVTVARPAYFPETDGYVEVPVFTRARLEEVSGPAIVEDAESTIVIPPGWTARLAEAMAVILTRTGR
ncbi:hypothetical protein, partial [Streptosporangium sp. NPDC003464]